MNDRRIARLQEQIKERLAEILLRDIADPKLGMVTITRVVLDSEFTHCKAYWSVLGTGGVADDKVRKDTQGVLVRARGLCQREVGKALHTRTIPHLEFVYDAGIVGGIQMNKLLADLAHERELREQQKNVPPGTEPPTAEPPTSGPTPG